MHGSFCLQIEPWWLRIGLWVWTRHVVGQELAGVRDPIARAA